MQVSGYHPWIVHEQEKAATIQDGLIVKFGSGKDNGFRAMKSEMIQKEFISQVQLVQVLRNLREVIPFVICRDSEFGSKAAHSLRGAP